MTITNPENGGVDCVLDWFSAFNAQSLRFVGSVLGVGTVYLGVECYSCISSHVKIVNNQYLLASKGELRTTR